MKFELEEEKYYKTRDGRKVGPMNKKADQFYDTSETLTGYGWHKSGKFLSEGVESSLDLVKEWKEEKALFNTVKVINQGRYPFFTIYEEFSNSGLVLDINGVFMEGGYDELKELANQLLEIAEYWESK